MDERPEITAKDAMGRIVEKRHPFIWFENLYKEFPPARRGPVREPG